MEASNWMLLVTKKDWPSAGDEISASAGGGSLTLMLTEALETPPWPSSTLRVMLWWPAGSTDENFAKLPRSPLTFEVQRKASI